MADATPRVNATHLGSFQQRTVRIVGKVTELRGDQATIDAGGNINLLLNRDAHLTLNNAAEIIGKVDRDLNVRVLNSKDFGDKIDYTVANAVVEATHRFPEIFYEKD